MKFPTMIKDWIKDRLESVFVPYTLSKRIENEIESVRDALTSW
jgi:hypothetical protein